MRRCSLAAVSFPSVTPCASSLLPLTSTPSYGGIPLHLLLKFLVLTTRSVRIKLRVFVLCIVPSNRCASIAALCTTHNLAASNGACGILGVSRTMRRQRPTRRGSVARMPTTLCTLSVAGTTRPIRVLIPRSHVVGQCRFSPAPPTPYIMLCAACPFLFRTIITFFFVATTGVAHVFHPRAAAQNNAVSGTPFVVGAVSTGRVSREGRFLHSSYNIIHCESQ